MTGTKQAERDEAITKLREILPPGSTVTTVLQHVSKSGMTRDIRLVVCADGSPWDISWLVARATGDRVNRDHGGIRVSGCGMDMGFALVYGLARTLYPNGHTCTGDRCPSNDHSNGDRDYTPHNHSDGGYALRQEWL